MPMKRHFPIAKKLPIFFQPKGLRIKQFSVPAHSVELFHFITTFEMLSILDWGGACLFHTKTVKPRKK